MILFISFLFTSAKSLLFCRILEWGQSPFYCKIRLICQPVEESYDKVKMFKVRKSSRAVALTRLNTLKTVETITPKNPNKFRDVFFSITFSVAGLKCKMLRCTYLFLQQTKRGISQSVSVTSAVYTCIHVCMHVFTN